MIGKWEGIFISLMGRSYMSCKFFLSHLMTLIVISINHIHRKIKLGNFKTDNFLLFFSSIFRSKFDWDESLNVWQEWINDNNILLCQPCQHPSLNESHVCKILNIIVHQVPRWLFLTNIISVSRRIVCGHRTLTWRFFLFYYFFSSSKIS